MPSSRRSVRKFGRGVLDDFEGFGFMMIALSPVALLMPIRIRDEDETDSSPVTNQITMKDVSMINVHHAI